MEDSKKFFPNMKVLPLSKNIKSLDYLKLYNEWNRIDVTGSYIDIDEDMELGIKKIPRDKLNFILKDLKRRAQHYIINMDLFRDKDDSEDLMKELKFSGIILDESALIKNYDSQSARRMRVFSKNSKIKNFYLLSGKPAPNNDSEYFSQMKIIDPDTFHMTRNDFIKEFFNVTKYGKVNPIQSKSKKLANMVSKRSLVISKEDCLDLPEYTNVVNSVQLDDITIKRYASMYQNFITEIESISKESKHVKVNTMLGSLMKLRQIANGFILDHNQAPFAIHQKKINRLEEILDDIGQSQVIIWHNFDYELEMISSLLNKMNKTFVTANGKTKNLDENIASFKAGNVDIIVANLRTLKYGVTLTNSHYAIYYSLSFSFEDYYQSQARIHRYGQKNECTYFFILAEDTIDQNLYRAVIGKESRVKFFEGLLKDAVKFGVDYERVKDLIKFKKTDTIDIVINSSENIE
jgi:SNF2 family DNA or RNA helicase